MCRDGGGGGNKQKNRMREREKSFLAKCMCKKVVVVGFGAYCLLPPKRQDRHHQRGAAQTTTTTISSPQHRGNTSPRPILLRLPFPTAQQHPLSSTKLVERKRKEVKRENHHK